jgi:hypothetical protein
VAKSTTFKTDLLKFELNGTALPGAYAGPFYVALHTADPGNSGTAVTSEATYTGYARQLIARTTAGFTVNGSVATNAAVILFPTRTAGSETITHFSIVTTASGAGTIIERGAFVTPLLVNGSVRPRIPIGGLSIAEDSVDASSVITPSGLMGTNLDGLYDYSSMNWVTVNVFKASRPFLSGTIGGAFYDVDANNVPTRTLTVDADGYPTSLLANQRAQSIILLADGYPTGNYIVTWDGVGTLNVVPAPAGSTIVSSVPNRIVFNIPTATADGVYISIDSTTPGNHVRNIKVKHSSLEFSEEYWHPTFVAGLSYFSTLRMMDLQRTNDSPITSWSQRATLTSASWCDVGGVPVEALVNLANKAHCNPWLCMPHQVDDAYVSNFAVIVRNNLDAGLKPYVECSNEVWNFQFQQASYALAQANANTARYGTDGAGWIHWHSARTKAMHAAWNGVYLDNLTGYVRVLGAQASNSYLLGKACSFEGNGASFDCAAIAPYFGYSLGLYDTSQGGMGATVAGWSASRLLDEIETTQLAQVISWVDSHVTVCATYGLRLIAYECGQHLVRVGTAGTTTDNALDAVLVAVQSNARMGAFYTTYFNTLQARMGRPLCHFSHSGGWGSFGSWGARQRLSDPVDATQPKAFAIYNLAIANP